MKKTGKWYKKRLFALILALTMIFGQSASAWADEAVGMAEAAEEITSEQAFAESVAEAQQEAALEAEPVEIVLPELQNAQEAEVSAEGAAPEEPLSKEAQEKADRIEEILEAAKDTASEPEQPAAAAEDDTQADILATPALPSGNKIPFTSASINIVPPKERIVYKQAPAEPEYKLYVISGGNVTYSELAKNVDYTVAYRDNKVPGYGTVTFTSSGNSLAPGSMEEYFWIHYGIDKEKAKITVSGQTIKVSNNDIYAYYVTAVSKNAAANGHYFDASILLRGQYVASGNTVTISSYYDANGRKHNMAPESEYDIWACVDENTYLTPVYTYEGNTYEIEDAVEFGTYKTLSGSPEPADPGYADGTGTDLQNMKAVTNKDQSVKVSWKGVSKTKYKLYALNEAGAETQIWPLAKSGTEWNPTSEAKAGSSMTFNLKNHEKYLGYLRNGVVVLELYENDGTTKKSGEKKYLTSVAPYLFYVEGGRQAGEQEYCWSYLNESENLGYKLQAAQKNKEGDADGWKDEAMWSTDVPSQGLESISFKVSNKLSTSAYRSTFYGQDLLKNLPAAKLYFRTKTVKRYKGYSLASVPSNVMSMKPGAQKPEVFSIMGVNPQTYYSLSKNATEEEAASYGVHAAEDSFGTCWKNGYVMFYSPLSINAAKDKTYVTKVELLRNDSKCGTFKVMKTYNATTLDAKYNSGKNAGKFKPNGLYSLNLPQGNELRSYLEEAGYNPNNVYFIQFNNFPPMETWYYSIRVVASVNGAKSGFMDGTPNTTHYEKVQDLFLGDYGNGKVELFWKHDDCAKQYWVYRGKGVTEKEAQEDLMRILRKDPNTKESGTDQNPAKPYKKVGGTTPKKVTSDTGEVYKYHLLADTKVSEKGPNGDFYFYHYYVRPVYNSKAEASPDRKYEDVTRTEEGVEKYYPGFIHDGAMMVQSVKPSTDGVHINKVTVTAYSATQLTAAWTQAPSLKGGGSAIKYLVEWREQGGTVSWNKKLIAKADPETKAAFSKRSFVAGGLKIGKTYEFRVKPGYTSADIEENEEGWDKLYDKKTPANKMAMPLKAVNLRAGKRSGKRGANVTWTIAKNDQQNWQDGKLKCVLKSTDGVNVTFDNKYQVQFSYADDRELSRGTVRHYTLYILAADASVGSTGQQTQAFNYSKPSYAEVKKKDSSTIKVGDSATFEVYLKNNENGYASVKDLDHAKSTDTKVLEVSDVTQTNEGVRIKVKGVRAGSASVKIKAWDDGPTKTVDFTVINGSGSSSMRPW